MLKSQITPSFTEELSELICQSICHDWILGLIIFHIWNIWLYTQLRKNDDSPGMANRFDFIIYAIMIAALLTGCASNQPVVQAPSPQELAWANRVIALDAEQKALQKREQELDNRESQAVQNQPETVVKLTNAEAMPFLQPKKDQTEKEAIDSVIIQINVAESQYTNAMCALMQDPIAAGLTHKLGDIFQKYHDDLVAIDISGCPEDFRIAFVKYYQAVEGLKVYADSITGWNGVLKGFVNCVHPLKNLNDLHDNTDKALDPLAKAGNEFELVCTKYHVDIK